LIRVATAERSTPNLVNVGAVINVSASGGPGNKMEDLHTSKKLTFIFIDLDGLKNQPIITW
jgi:hypothetical protein